MRTIEVDERTFERLRAAARLAEVRQRARVTEGQVVAELVNSLLGEDDPASRVHPDLPKTPAVALAENEIPIFNRYRGRGAAAAVESDALFDKRNGAVAITSGPLAGQKFPTLSAAAMALVRKLNPKTTPNRDGWHFWRLRETGEAVNVLRERGEVRKW